MEIRRFGVLRCTWKVNSQNDNTNWPKWSDADLLELLSGTPAWTVASYWQACTFGLVRPQFSIAGKVVLNGTNVGTAAGKLPRQQVIALARQAAQNANMDLSAYAGVLAFVDPPSIDAGGLHQSGDAALDGNGFLEFYAHEVGHMLRFEHAFGPQGVYSDVYCLMGTTNPQSHVLSPALPFSKITPLHPQFWQEGRRPAAASLYRYLPAFAQSASVLGIAAVGEGTFDLVAVSEAALGDPILLVCKDPVGEFTVEYRTKTQQDQNVAQALVVHSIGRNLVPPQNNEVRPVWFEVAITAPFSQRWLAPRANLCIEVVNLSPDQRRMQVRVSRPFPIDRCRHSGCLIQSEFGLGNYEVLVCRSEGRLQHFWRDNGDRNFPWHAGHVYSFVPSQSSGDVAAAKTAVTGVSLIRSTIKGDGQHGNFDAVLRMQTSFQADSGGGHLCFCAFDTNTMQWTPIRHIAADGLLVEGVTGTPALVQSDYGSVGNYEMLVPAGSQLRHYWRDNNDPHYPWHAGHVYEFAGSSHQTGPTAAVAHTPIGAAMLVSSIKGDGVHGNFDVIVRLRPWLDPSQLGDGLSFCSFDTGTRQWTNPQPIIVDGQPIRGVTGDPAFMQSTFGSIGNYELLVPIGSELHHFWRDNDDLKYRWHAGKVFTFHPPMPGSGDGGTASVLMDVLGVSVLQSSMRGDGIHGNFEAILLLSPRLDPEGVGARLYSCTFDTGKGQWSQVKTISADGAVVGSIMGL